MKILKEDVIAYVEENIHRSTEKEMELYLDYHKHGLDVLKWEKHGYTVKYIKAKIRKYYYN